MNINEAIEIQENFLKTIPDPRYPLLFHAMRLGIEALKRFRNMRDGGQHVGMPLLRGETPK